MPSQVRDLQTAGQLNWTQKKARRRRRRFCLTFLVRKWIRNAENSTNSQSVGLLQISDSSNIKGRSSNSLNDVRSYTVRRLETGTCVHGTCALTFCLSSSSVDKTRARHNTTGGFCSRATRDGEWFANVIGLVSVALSLLSEQRIKQRLVVSYWARRFSSVGSIEGAASGGALNGVINNCKRVDKLLITNAA